MSWDLVVAAAIVIYLLAFIPARMRRLEFRSTIDVRCAPKDAFALVSDPNNWHRYVPELSLTAPVRTPVGIGDVIHDRIVRPNITNDGVERVIAYEPGVRFGTQMITGGHGTTGVYDFAWSDGITRITFSCQATLTLAEAWLGNGFRRGFITAQMKAGREVVMQRIKGLLEAEPAEVNV